MDLVLKTLSGPEKDQVFACSAPESYLGRSQRCVVRLSSQAVSFEHALITRKGDDFFIENLSANGTLLNNERLGSAGAAGNPADAKTRLRQKDTIQLAPDVVLRVESLPAASAGGASRRWLLVAVVLLLVALLVVVVTNPLSDSTSPANWSKAYQPLQEFTQRQADQHLLPTEFPNMFREAWRMQISGDKSNAAAEWKRLAVLLDNWDEKQSLSGNQPSAQVMQALKDGKTVDLTEEGRAALKYFITMMSRKN